MNFRFIMRPLMNISRYKKEKLEVNDKYEAYEQIMEFLKKNSIRINLMI